MVMTTSEKWFPRGLAFLVWALVAASAVYWGLRWGGSGASVAAASVPMSAVPSIDTTAVARLLGGNAVIAQAAPAAAASRFTLTGVVARTHTHSGAALIAVDAKPTKSFSVGAMVDDGLYLVSVAPRVAKLGPSPRSEPSLTLEMPAPKP